MSVENKAIENIQKIVQCLELTKETLSQLRQDVADLQAVVRLQDSRLEAQASAFKALQGQHQTLHARLMLLEGRGFAV